MDGFTLKYTVPDCTGTLPRHNLSRIVDAIPRHRVTLIIAGAGYGKTTLTAQACARLGIRALWIRPQDHTLATKMMAAQIATGIRQYFSDFKWPARRDQTSKEPTAVMFAQALEASVTSDLYLVVEDCHQLGPEACLFFQSLLNRFFPSLHLVFVGRYLPQMKFSRLTAQGQVLRVSAADLAFTRKETAQLLHIFFEQPVPDRDMDLLEHKTRGWVSGIILFHQMLIQRDGNIPGGSKTGEAMAGLKGTYSLIGDYFRENIYDALDHQSRSFLVKTCILTRVDTDFCDRFLEAPNSRETLCRLENRTGFIISAREDRDRFFYHPLFREFLEGMISEELGAGARRLMHNRAATCYASYGRGREALTHHILAGNIQEAAGLMNPFARPVIKQEHPLMLKSLLSVIPAKYMDDEPWFQYLQAGYYGLCSQLTLAVNAYEKVLKGFRRKNDRYGECLTLMELAEHHLAGGRIKEAEQSYSRILGKDILGPYLTIICTGYLIRVLAMAGRAGEADKYAARAVRLLHRLKTPSEMDLGRAWIYTAQGYRYAFSGNYKNALVQAREAERLFLDLGQDRLVLSAYFLISYSCFYLGRFSRGMAAARQGLEISQKKGIRDEFTEFLRLLLARNSLERDSISGSEISGQKKEVRKSLFYFKTNDFPAGLAQGYLVLSRACSRLGETGSAEQYLRRGMGAVKNISMPLIKNELKVALAELLLFQGGGKQKSEAFDLLRAAEQELLQSGWHMARVSRVFARYYWEHGHRETADKYMIYCLKICEDESFDTWMAKEKDWAMPLFVHLYAMGSLTSCIEKIVRRMGNQGRRALYPMARLPGKREKKAVAALMAVIPDPCPQGIVASFFGRFKLCVGSRQINADQWKSRKALTLLKFLMANTARGYIEKEVLMELLWPEEDPQKSSQRFHVALAALRKTLEPEIPRGMRSSYIKRSGQGYRVDITENGRVDVDRFSAAVDAGDRASATQEAMTHYARAQALYKGDFLEEEVYEDWCARRREWYRANFLKVLKKTMAFHGSKKEYDRAIDVAGMYLEKDPYAEEIVRSLMQYHADAGNSPMVSRVYTKFSRSVQKEFNCSVSEKTRDLYHRLSLPRQDVWDTRMLESFKIPGSL